MKAEFIVAAEGKLWGPFAPEKVAAFVKENGGEVFPLYAAASSEPSSRNGGLPEAVEDVARALMCWNGGRPSEADLCRAVRTMGDIVRNSEGDAVKWHRLKQALRYSMVEYGGGWAKLHKLSDHDVELLKALLAECRTQSGESEA